MNNQEKQSEEILALQSIFEDQKLTIDLDATPTRGRVLAAVRLPDTFFVVQKPKKVISISNTSSNDEDLFKKIKVGYLPPLDLLFELPDTYPSDSAPAFLLSCSWLTLKQISLLCKKLESMWNDGDGEVILYQWIRFLEEELLSYLAITDTLDVSNLCCYKRWKMVSPEKRNVKRACDLNFRDYPAEGSAEQTCKTSPTSDTISSAPSCQEPRALKKRFNSRHMALKPRIYGGLGPIDLRAMLDLTNGRMLFTSLKEYDKAKKEDVFQETWVVCRVCFQEKQGSRFSRFKECNHVYCKECMQSYFEIQIRDGNVSGLNCPEEKCSSEADAMQVRELVDAQLFAKYDELLLSRTLDTMPDVTYCPRKMCQSPVIAEQGSHMGTCPQCKFVFCMFCRMASHGIAPCNFKSEEKRGICAKYLKSVGEEKELMEKRYGRKVLQFLVDNTLSEDWMKSNSKKCPQCNASIEKTEGCNKMTCFRCGAYFCWLCTARLKATNPYLHFSDPNSFCYDKLFPAIHDDDVDDDDDDFIPGEFL